MERRALFAGAVVAVLAVASAFPPFQMAERAVAQAGAPVHIISPLPLPTTGTTAISGPVDARQSGSWNVGVTGSVPVTQGGPWTVALTGSPNVVIANPADTPVLVRNVDEPGRAPYLEEVELSNPPNNTTAFCQTVSSCSLHFPAVPSGKRLVVESISGAVFTHVDDSLGTVSLSSAGRPIGYLAPFSSEPQGLARRYTFNTSFTSYVEEGVTPIVFVVVASSTTQAVQGHQRAAIVIAGHLVDIQ
jgi:hypothetical protein